MPAGTITLRQTSVTGAVNAARALTYDELDSNFLFLQSGSAAPRTVQSRLRELIFQSDYASYALFATAKASFTGPMAFTDPTVCGSPVRPTVEIFGAEVGSAKPQLRLTYGTGLTTDFRCDISGDLLIESFGSTTFFLNTVDTQRTSLWVIPKGTVTGNPATLELFGTDRQADAVNFEKLMVSSKGSSDSAHVIESSKGGSGTARSIHIYCAGVANALWVGGDGNNGVGTITPRRKFDILDSTNPQLRLSQADNAKYVDLAVDATGNLTVKPNGTTKLTVNASGAIVAAGTIEIDGNYLYWANTTGTKLYGDANVAQMITAGSARMTWNNDGSVAMNTGKLYLATDAAAAQTATGLYAGTGVPNNANGANGDIYFRSDGGAGTTIYQRRVGVWVATGA